LTEFENIPMPKQTFYMSEEGGFEGIEVGSFQDEEAK
jgi:hypothetical protein